MNVGGENAMNGADRRRGRRGRQSCSDDVFDDVKPSCPVVCGLNMVREEPRKSTDILQCESTIRKQVHGRPQKASVRRLE
jgi:hypothetical protein